MLARAGAPSSAGYQTPGAMPPRSSSRPKAAVAWPTHCSRSSCATRSVSAGAVPPFAYASTRMALVAPTRRSTARMMGSEKRERACILSLSPRSEGGSAFIAPKR
eukprot:1050109-Prymnesium_polylepis.1